MKIEVGKFYRTRGGQKARIYATYGTKQSIVHGAIEVGYVVWELIEWTGGGGRIFMSGPEHDSDLISEWEEPAPKIIAYVSIADWSGGRKTLMLVNPDKTVDLREWRRAPWLDEP